MRTAKFLINKSFFASLLLFSACANASLVTFNFKGTVDSIVTELSGTFTYGNIFSGHYTFDSSTPDVTFSEMGIGLYYGAIKDFSLKIGSYSATASNGDIFIFDNSEGIDEYQVNVSRSDHGLSGLSVNGYDLDFFQLFVNNSKQTALNSKELPLIPPKLDDFNNGILRIGFGRPGDNYSPQISVFNFQSSGTLELAPVPLPAGIWLFSFSIICMLGFERYYKIF